MTHVGKAEENKTMGSKGVTIRHLKGKEKNTLSILVSTGPLQGIETKLKCQGKWC